MEKLQADGLVKSIGVSNFEIDDLKVLLKEAKVKPVINQILFHPYVWSSKKPLVEFMAEHDIKAEAYSGLIVSPCSSSLQPRIECRPFVMLQTASDYSTWRTSR